MTSDAAFPSGPPAPGAQPFFEGRLARAPGQRVFAVALVFALPLAASALALLWDTAVNRPSEIMAWAAAGFVLALAVFAGVAARTAFRMIGSRYWIVREGLFLDRPERLIAIPPSVALETGWKKGMGPCWKFRGVSAAPGLVFLPGLLLKWGDALTVYAVAFGDDAARVESALRRISTPTN